MVLFMAVRRLSASAGGRSCGLVAAKWRIWRVDGVRRGRQWRAALDAVAAAVRGLAQDLADAVAGVFAQLGVRVRERLVHAILLTPAIGGEI